MLVHEQLRRFEGSIVAATKGRLGRRLVDPSTAAAVASSLPDDGPGWSFKESLLYSVTVITTIGEYLEEFASKRTIWCFCVGVGELKQIRLSFMIAH